LLALTASLPSLSMTTHAPSVDGSGDDVLLILEADVP
jgi:hypothetical protein